MEFIIKLLIMISGILALSLFGLIIYFSLKSKNIKQNDSLEKEKDAHSEQIKNEALTKELVETKTQVNNILNKLSSLNDRFVKLDNVIDKENKENRSGIKEIQENLLKIDEQKKIVSQYNKEKINDIFKRIEQLGSQLDKSEEKSDNLSDSIETLNSIFISSKKRGVLGELSMNFIFDNIFGSQNTLIHKQKSFPNGKIPDAYFEYKGDKFPFDSKFPYTNYVNLLKINKKTDHLQYKAIENELKKNIETHIRKIAKDYIDQKINSKHAFMYIPSQAVFEYIYSEKSFENILKIALNKNVIITGPNTLPVILKFIFQFFENEKMNKEAHKVIKFLKPLEADFKRFHDRWESFTKTIDKFYAESRKITTTQNKINNKFDNISKLKLVEPENDSPNKLEIFSESEKDLNIPIQNQD